MSDDLNAPSKVIINGQEYDPTEAQEYIETGRKTRELEEKYNTKLDNVWPGYNEASQKAAKYEQELTEARRELEEFRAKQTRGTETPSDEKDAKEAARKLGLVLNEDLGNQGFIKKDDLDKYLSERDQQAESRRQVEAEADRYEKEIDGKDGRPAFNKKAVIAYAVTYKLPTLMEAYEDMHGDRLKSWKDSKIEEERSRGLKTLGRDGDKSPKNPKVNKDNLGEMIRESLSAGEE